MLLLGAACWWLMFLMFHCRRGLPGRPFQTRMCLEDLMQSDEDMLGLLLTETKELGQGEVTPRQG